MALSLLTQSKKTPGLAIQLRTNCLRLKSVSLARCLSHQRFGALNRDLITQNSSVSQSHILITRIIIISIYSKFAKLTLGPRNHTLQLQMVIREHLSCATNLNIFLG